MTEAPEQIVKKQVFGNETFDVVYKKGGPRPPMGAMAERALKQGRLPVYVFDGTGNQAPLNPRTYEVAPGIICEQDVAVPMRDGVITYCDIYRPIGQTNIPVIYSMSFYGKRPGVDDRVEWQHPTVPEGSVSPSAKFESADPEYWCYNGYAVANYDPRGVNNSEGDIDFEGSRWGRDGYDLVEFLAAQEWCNGKVGSVGNSAVAANQWKIASERPPHLACMAPWEGFTDAYRDLLKTGGINEVGFIPGWIHSLFAGEDGYLEDPYEMTLKYPLMNAYWEDKIPNLENIEVPAYVCAGWHQYFHLRGTLLGFERLGSKDKWLRIHSAFEWGDQYHRDNIDDLHRFFDRYLKGIRNGWESTPRVRVDVMDAYEFNMFNRRPENEWPLARTEYRKLYLDAAKMSLETEPVKTASSVSYDAMTEKLNFVIKFAEDTELTGFFKARLWVEADGHDDMDLFVAVQKLNASGEFVPTTLTMELNGPMVGAHYGNCGKLRVSLRETDPEKSTEFRPFHTFKNPQKLSPGEIVPVDIEIFPTSKFWHAGEQLRLEVAGFYAGQDWLDFAKYDIQNEGKHIIHAGGQYDSYLMVPYIPPKYVAGDYIYR